MEHCTPNSPPEMPTRTLSFTGRTVAVLVAPLPGSPFFTDQLTLPVLASSDTTVVSAWCRMIAPSA